MGGTEIIHRLPGLEALGALAADAEALLAPRPIDATFRGDLLRLATQATLRDKRLLADPAHPLADIAYVVQGGLHTYVHHGGPGTHAGKRVVVDLHPARTFVFPLRMGATSRHPLHTGAVGDTELLFITVDGLLELALRHPQAIELVRKHSQWQHGRHLAMHAGLSYTDVPGKLRWMKKHYPYFYRCLSNQCIGSFLGLDIDTVRKNRLSV